MKKNRLKALIVVICAFALMVPSFQGTLSYFTSQAEITNTFTVGKVDITLTESKTDKDGVVIPGSDRSTEGNRYDMVPGHIYVKDPEISVSEDSHDCYLFVKVCNQLAAIEMPDGAGYASLASQMDANGWEPVGGISGLAENEAVYFYNGIASPGKYPVFGEFGINMACDSAALEACNGKTISIVGYAIQADGVDMSNVAAVWTNAFGTVAP